MRGSVESYPKAAVERAMKVQEVVLRAIAKKITWRKAAEIVGLSGRQLRRLRRFHARGLMETGMKALWVRLTFNIQAWMRLRTKAIAAHAG
jgi:hypothetical protein